ncbi:hypothetical protein QBC34DRAFT_153661 [Podospora aff. communis PSN243]|uniref:Aminoglycoside phosphotransferase domain-containing protein n=1 Tax=Podospora aff. communis PSN243 TaxID=3040156 RepID=A0AAV9GCM5_9PEZI|nr:hypothetical protein QBC34DRAFT_153661 [Podospora aff. communis PSN243]
MAIDKNTAEYALGVIDAVQNVHLQKLKMAPWDKIGSLYYDWDGGDTSEGGKGYFVGPMVSPHFWVGYRTRYLDIRRGPFLNVPEYLDGILSVFEAEIAATDNYLQYGPTGRGTWYTTYQIRAISAAIQTFRKKLIPSLITWDAGLSTVYDPSVNTWPFLHHGSPHANNVLVSTSTGALRAIIDWEKSTIEPHFARTSFPYPKLSTTYKTLWKHLGDGIPRCALPRPERKHLPQLIKMGDSTRVEVDGKERRPKVPKSLCPPLGERMGREHALRMVVRLAMEVADVEHDMEREIWRAADAFELAKTGGDGW